MAASTSMRPHSATSSGSSTPWLSPEASSSTWRPSSASSVDLSRRTSSASTRASVNPLDGSQSAEWWEHVLPPGQLAERLRKAQRSSSSSRRRNNPALAKATPSERSAWKRLSGLPKDQTHQIRSEASSATSSRRSSFQGSPSAATLPRSALPSGRRPRDATAVNSGTLSHSVSSTEVSSDELGGTSSGQQSPRKQSSYAFPSSVPVDHHSSRRSGVRTTGNNSPEMDSINWTATDSSSAAPPNAFDSSRSTSHNASSRRMRVMSEDGLASFQSVSSYRLPGSQSAVHLSQFASTSHDTTSWSSIAADRSRASSSHHSLPDTPELSCDEAADVTSFTTTSRTRKTSTTRTTVRTSTRVSPPPTILRSHFDQPDQPPCPLDTEEGDGASTPSRRERHVSFTPTAEMPRRASVQEQCSEPMSHSQSAFSFGHSPSREYASPFDSLPPRSNSTRRPRQGVRVSGHRSTSFSLPGSRRGSIHEFGPATPPASGSSHHHRSTSIPDAIVMESLSVAHKQLASAGSIALTVTRQLSAPLRPVFHMTLLLGISSITVMSLACFLCASYMLTAWDDVSRRTHKVGEVAGTTKDKIEKTLDWGLRMLGPHDVQTKGSSKPAAGAFPAGSMPSSGTATPPSGEPTAARGAVSSAGHAFLWPARAAFSVSTSVASKVAPPGISKIFEPSSTSESKPRPKASTLPPRPPLSTLLPSILFTLLLAIGAGLTSFFASRRAASESTTSSRGGNMASPQPYTVPLSSTDNVPYAPNPAASSFAGRRSGGSSRGYGGSSSSTFVRA